MAFLLADSYGVEISTSSRAAQRLRSIYKEVEAEASIRETGQAPRQPFDRAAEAKIVCIAESLGPRTQVLSGIPWVLPGGGLSDKGQVLDRHLLRPVGYSADPYDISSEYAYLTDVSHLWLGRRPDGKLRRPTRSDKEHCASWLEQELLAVRPRVVVLLGMHAASFVLQRYAKIKLRKLEKVLAVPLTFEIGDLEVVAVPTLHPTGAQMARGGSAFAYRDTVRVLADALAE